MDNLKYLIENNIVCLEQGINLLAAIEDDVYTHSDPPVYTSGIGDHYRHCVEHYLSFINGIEAQCIDYDARKRDLRVSTERDHAIQVTKEIIAALKGLSCPGAVVRVKMDCNVYVLQSGNKHRAHSNDQYKDIIATRCQAVLRDMEHPGKV